MNDFLAGLERVFTEEWSTSGVDTGGR